MAKHRGLLLSRLWHKYYIGFNSGAQKFIFAPRFFVRAIPALDKLFLLTNFYDNYLLPFTFLCI
jgi:hypothetical protein